MIKPKNLQKGDKVAIVSLSRGILGDANFIHKYHIAKERLENEFGLVVETMPNALKGSDFLYNNPKLRAEDLLRAFEDTTVKAIICAIGGDDTIRLLPFIDFDIIKNNPKIFMGFSDSTVNHFFMYKAGLVSFYGPNIMCDFGEYIKMFDYTKSAICNVIFKDSKGYKIESSSEWSKDFVFWNEKNINILKKTEPETRGYEVLQGKGISKGHMLGGCIDAFCMIIGTSIWPSIDKWKDAILFFETSEDKPKPFQIKYILRNLAAQGILKVLKGIIVGKPQEEMYYDEYKETIIQVVKNENNLDNLPIFYNINFGHAMPIGIIPYGILVELDCENKTITLLESATDSYLS